MRLWFSPQVLLGALVVVLGALAMIISLPRSTPPQFTVEEALTPTETTAQTVELVTFEIDSAGRDLEQPFTLTLDLPSELASRYERILTALRETLQGSLWPATLPTPVVFVLNEDERPRLVLDFTVTTPPALTVDDERLLLAAIRETLLRNGAERVQILVNHSDPVSFLGHVAPD